MATFRIKRRAVGGAAGAPTGLKSSELAFNEVDKTLYYGFGDSGSATASSVIAIAGEGAFLTLTTAQTVTGAKTFTGAVVIPTLAAGDNSTGAASTAFVKSQNYLTGNQNVSVSGDATGSGTTAITLALSPSGVTAGTYTKVTVDAKGRATSGGSLSSADVTAALTFTPVSTAVLGAANGVATLGPDSKITASQLPASVTGGMSYVGTWNASTNSPALTTGTGTKGAFYKVSVAGSTALDGNSTWRVGDQVVFNGTAWDAIDGGTADVNSVAGRVGTVVLTTTDVGGLGTVATENTVPVTKGGIGLTTAVNGLLKGTGAAYVVATVDVDYLNGASVIDGGTF